MSGSSSSTTADRSGKDGSTTLGAAIGHAVIDVPTGRPELTAGEMRARLEQGGLAEVRKIVVVEHQKPVGLVPVERLLSAEDGQTLDRLMDADPPVVTFDTDEEVAAHEMASRGQGCLVVVGPGGGLVGLVFPEQMLAVVLAEHGEGPRLDSVDGLPAGSHGDIRTGFFEERFQQHALPSAVRTGVQEMFAAALDILGTRGRLAFEVSQGIEAAARPRDRTAAGAGIVV